MTYCLENYITSPALKAIVSHCGIIISENRVVTAQEIEFLISKVVTKALADPKFAKEICD